MKTIRIKSLSALLLLCLSLPAAAIPIVELNPSNSVVEFGDEFTVDVIANQVDGFDPLLAFGFDIDVAAGFTLTAATVDSVFFDDSLFFPATDVAGSTFLPVSGNGILLATLSFMAGATVGAFDIAVSTDFSEFGFSEGLITLFGLADISAATTVVVQAPDQGPVPVPEPSLPSLLILGAALATWLRRRSFSATG